MSRVTPSNDMPRRGGAKAIRGENEMPRRGGANVLRGEMMGGANAIRGEVISGKDNCDVGFVCME